MIPLSAGSNQSQPRTEREEKKSKLLKTCQVPVSFYEQTTDVSSGPSNIINR